MEIKKTSMREKLDVRVEVAMIVERGLLRVVVVLLRGSHVETCEENRLGAPNDRHVLLGSPGPRDREVSGPL